VGGTLGAIFVRLRGGSLMPQVLKAEVRERILGAALAAFARGGYAATTMVDIARDAGVAVANVYRYYPSKEELFEAAVPPELVQRFDELLENSVRAHAHLAGVARPADEAAGRELLDFWIQHRLVVVVLLGRSRGSIHAEFGQRFVARLTSLSITEIRAAHPGVVIPREAKLVLEQIFENTRRMIGAILESCEEEREIRRSVAAFRSYQVAGLGAFARWLVADAARG
jgi:AcrR family transcriptional regulator